MQLRTPALWAPYCSSSARVTGGARRHRPTACGAACLPDRAVRYGRGRLVADLTFEEAAGDFDIILVAGAPTPPETEPEPHLVQWVKELPWRSGVYGSICTGAFLLGYAGLLDDRHFTTHWQDAQALAARFPKARVEPDLIYVRAMDA